MNFPLPTLPPPISHSHTDKNTNIQPLSWPVTGYAYDVLIGGPFKDQKPEWDYGLHGYTLELAVPVNQGAKLLRRVRQLFDQAAKDGKPVTATYRSGINIKVRACVENWKLEKELMVDWTC